MATTLMNPKPGINLQDDDGLTPLHKSIKNNDNQLTRYLLENGFCHQHTCTYFAIDTFQY